MNNKIPKKGNFNPFYGIIKLRQLIEKTGQCWGGLQQLFEHIGWRIYINASSKEKAERVIKRISKEIGEIEVLSFDVYWKDHSLYELECKTKLQIEEAEKAVFYTLQLVNQLGREIQVIGPIIYEDGMLFSGYCTKPSIIGVSWLHFYIES